MKPRKTWTIGSLPGVDVFSALDSARIEFDPQNLLVLAGAGVSVDQTSWLPTARDFLKALYKASMPETFDWSRLMISDFGPRFELVLDILQANFDPELDILGVFRSRRPNHNHCCLAALARQGALIVTTNFDVLIEQTLAEMGEFRCAFDPEHFASLSLPGAPDYIPTIWHLHGIIEDPKSHERRPESIVASIRDVWRSRHLFRLEATKGMFLARALEERDLLVVGYSGSDDYDIMPLLVEVPSDRTVIWVDHNLFEPAEGPPPSVQRVTFEGDCWYGDPALNALAEMIDQRRRPPEKIRLLKYKSSHVLQALSGLRDESDPLDNGPRPWRFPPIRDLPDEQMENYNLHLLGLTFGDFQLAEQLAPWMEKHLPSKASRYMFALALCEACGLQHELDILLTALQKESAAHKNAGNQRDRDVALAIYTVIVTSKSKAVPDTLLPYLPDFLSSMRVFSVAEALYAAAYEQFSAHSSAKRLREAEQSANEALSCAQDEGNPEVIARAGLLLARIAEAARREDSVVLRLYEEASRAAYDSGSQATIGEARGEMGIYLKTMLWAKLTTEARRRKPKYVVLESLAQLGEKCISALAEAYRVHAAQGNNHALLIVAGNLADVLELWEDQKLRSLRAQCIALFSSVQIEDFNAQQLARERILDSLSVLMPDLKVQALGGAELALTVLDELDQLPDSLI